MATASHHPFILVALPASENSARNASNPNITPPNRFLAGSSDSDDGDDKRVIKSARDKRVSALASTCDEIHVSRGTRGKITVG